MRRMIVDIAKTDPILTVSPSRLAHCRECCDPMYCIYDINLRFYCWACEQIEADVCSASVPQ